MSALNTTSKKSFNMATRKAIRMLSPDTCKGWRYHTCKGDVLGWFSLMATGYILHLASQGHLHIKNHMAINLLMPHWCLVILWKLKCTIDCSNILLNFCQRSVPDSQSIRSASSMDLERRIPYSLS
jgi:hypothetical protein